MLTKIVGLFRKIQDIEAQSIETELNPPFAILQPDNAATPFIFNSPHSGRTYPAAFLHASRLSGLSLRRTEDAYVDLLLEGVVNLGGTLMHAHFPRAYLDLNREPYELDPALFSGRLPDYANTHSLRVIGGLGTIARVVNEQEEIYRCQLPVSAALERIERLYKPYHETLKGLLDKARQQFGFAVLIDFHSMPSYQGDRGNTQKADFVLGDRFGTSCPREMVRAVERYISGLGYKVTLNKPYAGGYITEQYGNPNKGMHALQIEINRALYMDEETLVLRRDFRNVRAHVTQIAERVIEELPELLMPRRAAAAE
ncbi:MAG: N-formylglutamate amidohydrolase [Alphaproteobacteria bacterium]